MTSPSPIQIVADREQLERIQRGLEVTQSFVVMFVDLCNSTQLKARPQSEWLPTVCRFLTTVSAVATAQSGRVIKYIGDEVMIVFRDTDTLAASRAEVTVLAIDRAISELGADYCAKYVLDAGNVAEVDFPPLDVLGTAIDRCARIGKLAQPNNALASSAFRERSRQASNWLSVGSFDFKGLPDPTEVFRFISLGGDWNSPHPLYATRSGEELVAIIETLGKKVVAAEAALETCRSELNTFRQKQ